MENAIIIGILLLVVGGAGLYIYKAKKSGKKCIGCPDSAHCQHKGCSSCSGCPSSTDNNEE